MNGISVLVVDGSEIVRVGLCRLLDRDPALHVAGRATRADDALRLMPELRPGVVIVRDELPDRSGLALCRDLAERWPSCALVLLMTSVTDSSLRTALKAGVRGLIHLDTDADGIRSAVRSAASGLFVFDPRSSDRLIACLRQAPMHSSKPLSAREYEVMGLVTEGLASDAIAENLGLSINSVKTYVRRALDKLGCTTRVEAAARLSRTMQPS